MIKTPISETAIYLPAVSESYVRHDLTKPFTRPCPVPPSDLNFLDPASKLFHYPYALYSAGQGAHSSGSMGKTHMLSGRDRSRTLLFADSGGFQIQNGIIPFKGEETTLSILRWMEAYGDYSMALDFPTGGISRGTVRQHLKRLQREGRNVEAMHAANGLGMEFNACLKQTCINNDLMVRERVPGATNLLNVLQGRNEAESKTWYEEVKHYPFEGWAFAGSHQTSFTMALNRIVDLYNDGLLQKAKWLHFLGISKLWAACILTALQKCIRGHMNPDLQISFDSASPFRGAAKMLLYTGFILDRFGWSFVSSNFADIDPSLDKLTVNEWVERQTPPKRVRYAGNLVPREIHYASTMIGQKVTIGELRENDTKEGCDSLGVTLLMNHNLEVFLEAFSSANAIVASGSLRQMPSDYFTLKVVIEETFKRFAENDNPQGFMAAAGPQLDIYAHL